MLKCSNYDSNAREAGQDFKDYTQMEAQSFKDLIIQHMESIEQCIIQECMVQKVKATDASSREKDCKPMVEVPYIVEYNVFAVDTQHSEQPESITNTCVVEKVDSNVIPDSSNICDNAIQTDQNAEDERVVLANLIANLKLDVDEIQKQLKKANTSLAHELKECKSILAETSKTLGESNIIRDSCLIALQNKQTKLETYKTLNDRTVDYDKLEHKLDETIGLLAQKEIDIKQASHEYHEQLAHANEVRKKMWKDLQSKKLTTMDDNKSHGNIDGGEWVYVQRKQRSKVSRPPTSTLTGITRFWGHKCIMKDVQSLCIGDIETFERKLKSITIGSTKLVINRARYHKLEQRKKEIPKVTSDPPNLRGPNFCVSRNGWFRNNRSYRDATIDVDESLKKRLMNTRVGKEKNVDVLQNMWNSKDSASTSLQENLMWLNQWFDDLKMWKDDFVVSERLAWIKLDGIPVLVLTPLDMDVNRTLKVKVNGVVSSIKVLEDFKQPFILFPPTNNDLKSKSSRPQKFFVVEDDKEITRVKDLVFSDGTDTETPTNFENKTIANDSLENSSNSGVLGYMNTLGPNIEVVPDTQLGQDKPNESYVSRGPITDLNGPMLDDILKQGSVGDMDKELDDLMSSFQHISDTAYKVSKGTSLKRKSNNKKKNLVLGDTLISSSFMSAGNCVDFSFEPGVIRKIFGESIDFIYDNRTKAFGNPPEVKKGWIQRIALSKKLVFFGVQEAKMEFIDSFLVKSIWHRLNVDFSFVSSTGASGGTLSMWDDNIFLRNKNSWNCIEGIITSNPAIWIVFGDFNMVKGSDERAGSVFNEREALVFNYFISMAGIFDFHLGGRRFSRFDKSGSFSDHRPLILKDVSVNFGPKPFKVFDHWIGDKDSEVVIRNSWASKGTFGSPDLVLKSKIKRLRFAVKDWALKNNEAQNQTKQNILNNLSECNIKAESGCLSSRETDKREEWLMDLHTIKQVERDTLRQKTLISIDEIKTTVWSYAGNKAPVPDSFNFSFIKAYWDIMKSDFFDCIKYFEGTEKLGKGCNPSFIVLIPKKKDPLGFSDFRPIGLIGCVYKVISKILAIWLAKVIPTIIGPNQTAFLAGRQIIDGCLIANEIINMAKLEDQRHLLLKVDFEKAFNSVN
ncbi:transposon TX1 uncharacterized [Tanacetum coccineum]